MKAIVLLAANLVHLLFVTLNPVPPFLPHLLLPQLYHFLQLLYHRQLELQNYLLHQLQ